MALRSPNTVLLPVVLYATTTAGGTVTTLSPLATPGEIAKRPPGSSGGGLDGLPRRGGGRGRGRGREAGRRGSRP
ncbi:hypothetical protein [Streptomyces brasiliscabiei]|uniref:hypothetical protein n=1 Tax=Streptomyces brasiliscabiei TaxID=2736302 RepID=UPI003AF520C3